MFAFNIFPILGLNDLMIDLGLGNLGKSGIIKNHISPAFDKFLLKIQKIILSLEITSKYKIFDLKIAAEDEYYLVLKYHRMQKLILLCF